MGGTRFCIVLSGEDSGGTYSLIEFELPPRLSIPLHRHLRGDESVMLIAGTLSCTLNGREFALQVGDVVHIPQMTPHSFCNVGESPARILSTMRPSGYEDYFRELGTPIDSETSPSPPPRLHPI